MPKKKEEKTNTNTKQEKASFPKLQPKGNLEVVQVEANHIYTIPNFLFGKECEAIIQYFETHLPLVATPGIPKKGFAFRNNDRQSLHNPHIANELWKTVGLGDMIQKQVKESRREGKGLNSNIRIYRYSNQQSFGPHYDDSVQDEETGLWTGWTLLVYLNEDMEGGETVFYKDAPGKKRATPPPITVTPTRGTALIHQHGKNCLLHEALPVTQGNKWVLRSDVLMG
jgi:hypothetical protein